MECCYKKSSFKVVNTHLSMYTSKQKAFYERVKKFADV